MSWRRYDKSCLRSAGSARTRFVSDVKKGFLHVHPILLRPGCRHLRRRGRPRRMHRGVLLERQPCLVPHDDSHADGDASRGVRPGRAVGHGRIVWDFNRADGAPASAGASISAVIDIPSVKGWAIVSGRGSPARGMRAAAGVFPLLWCDNGFATHRPVGHDARAARGVSASLCPGVRLGESTAIRFAWISDASEAKTAEAEAD